MARINLETMSYKDLVILKTRIEDAIEARKQKEKAEVKRKIEELASESGFDVQDIVGAGGRSQRKGVKVPPKYRHPKNPSQTWTGRGRQPRWLVAEIKSGKKLNQFLIK